MDKLKEILAACDKRSHEIYLQLRALNGTIKELENPDFFINEERSVIWNRQEKALRLDKAQSEKSSLEHERINVYKPAVDYILDTIEAEGFNKRAAEVIYQKAYVDAHSAGYLEVAQQASDLCDFVHEVVSFQD